MYIDVKKLLMIYQIARLHIFLCYTSGYFVNIDRFVTDLQSAINHNRKVYDCHVCGIWDITQKRVAHECRNNKCYMRPYRDLETSSNGLDEAYTQQLKTKTIWGWFVWVWRPNYTGLLALVSNRAHDSSTLNAKRNK